MKILLLVGANVKTIVLSRETAELISKPAAYWNSLLHLPPARSHYPADVRSGSGHNAEQARWTRRAQGAEQKPEGPHSHL